MPHDVGDARSTFIRSRIVDDGSLTHGCARIASTFPPGHAAMRDSRSAIASSACWRNHARSRRLMPRVLAATLAAALVSAASVGAQADAHATAAAHDPRWSAIHQVFGQGEVEGRYFRINLPRSDLHVRIGDDALDPGFEFTSYVGFAPSGTANVMAMGEVILLEGEVPAVLAAARAQGVQVTAVHNHLIGEVPRIVYVHVMAQGASAAVANELKAVFAASATPLAPSPEEPAAADWTSIDAILGKHSEAHGRVAEYVFPRRERITVHGMRLESTGTLETASEVVFQQLANGRVANTGELYLLPSEVEPVVRSLGEHALGVTAIHTHMLDDGPPHFWVHWYATGDGPTLARGVTAALSHMRSAQQAAREGSE
jgi:hypothetical protein